MMTPELREEMRVIIQDAINELEEQQDHLKERLDTVSPDSSIGRLSRMDSLVNKGTLEIAYSENQKKLNRLRDKLTKVDSEDFGKCAKCGNWIPEERLKAAPDRGMCRACLTEK